MAKNHVSISFSEPRLTALAQAMDVMEMEFGDLISLPVAERRAMFKMGDKSEVFVRETIDTLGQNPKLVPEALNLPEAQADLAALDALRPLLRRLQQLVERAESTETALGADLMATALEGYALLKVSGRHQGLEGRRRELSARFVRSARVATERRPDVEPA